MIKLLKENKTFGGKTSSWQHLSKSNAGLMKFSTFIPESKKIDSCIIWLSGLTCTEENFIIKSGVQKYLNGTNTMIICPDTSPRGLDLLAEHDSYDFGSGAGFYVNSLTEGYKDHYNMFDYVSIDLHEIILKEFSIPSGNISISGHSMGGHGALIIGLTFPEKYHSISVFAPLSNPINVEWGRNAFRGYLGEENEDLWKKYDSCELIKSGKKHPRKILIDQGTHDEFTHNLLTENLIQVCKKHGQPIEMNFREDYDHSYYFISSFIESHINFHINGNSYL